ncbi:hypothetical protein D3C84_795750 [compost metagenome]
MALPAWRMPAGGEQGQARALPVSLIEQSGQQALGLAQGLIPPGRGRSIDNHQPQLMSTGRALLPAQVTALTRTAFEQGSWPGHGCALCGLADTPAWSLLDRTRAGLGIRRPGATDAQGFFAQFGTSRRAPVAVACGGISPQAPCPCRVFEPWPP